MDKLLRNIAFAFEERVYLLGDTWSMDFVHPRIGTTAAIALWPCNSPMAHP